MALGRVLVCIPTFNERENLPLIVRRLRSAVPEAEILVIDDGSPDGTGKVADELAYADPAIQVLHRTEKAGLGAAYIAGFRWGLDHGADVLVEMDADGSHQPEQLPRLLEALDGGADVALGSRYVAGGQVEDWPKHRLVLSVGGNVYVRMLLGLPLKDATGGYRAYKAAALKDIGYESVLSQGYCFQVDLAWRAWQRGLKIEEVPITFVERQVGASKMSGNIVSEALLRVTVWGLKSRRGKRPLTSA